MIDGSSARQRSFYFRILFDHFICALTFAGCQAPPDEFANSRRPARHSMPKSEFLNGLQFDQGEGDL